jgi:uncharacterized membrane protein YcaP (DUF421 family)
MEYLKVIFSSFVIYVFLIVCIRLFGKKELSQLSVIDLVFILLISNAVQNAMVGTNSTILGGLTAAITLFITNYILKVSLFKYPMFNRIVQGTPTPLVIHGVVQNDNLIKVRMTMDELKETIREHGINPDDMKKIDLVSLEIDGNISVLTNNFQSKSKKKRSPHKIFKHDSN